MFRSLIAIILVGLFISIPVEAQQVGAEPLTLSIVPEYPKPYQTITIIPASTVLDLNSSTVTLTANGTMLSKGSGAERTNVRLGGPGSATTITLSVVADGRTYTTQLSVRPADVALIIEPFTTAHPFYRGGTPVSSEGRLRIVAVPDIRTGGGRLSAENLVYTWKLGDQVLQAQSGIGKSSLTATAPVRYRDTAITLTVASVDSAYVAQATTVVAPIDPLVRIYRNDPLLGPLFENALAGTFLMDREEETYRAIPYFFSSTPSLTWMVNSAASGGEKDITLRSTGSGSGSANLTASAKQPTTFQSADSRLNITFGKEGGLGLFGL